MIKIKRQTFKVKQQTNAYMNDREYSPIAIIIIISYIITHYYYTYRNSINKISNKINSLINFLIKI